VVVVSIFDGRENAMRASEQVVGIMRERARDVAPNPPRVTAGKVIVAATPESRVPELSHDALD